MPEYIGSGSHTFQGEKYRFLVLKRYRCDLHSLIKNRRVDPKCVLIIASQIIDILEHLHDKGYAHSDIKSENLMIGSCTYKKDMNYNFDDRENAYTTPVKKRSTIDNSNNFSGSNPVRSCRTTRKTSMYDDMLKSHYLRPNKTVNYSKYYEESEYDYNPKKKDKDSDKYSAAESETDNEGVTSNYKEEFKTVTEDRIFLIDFGLASKFMDANGHHRPFCMDQRRAHDGTLEFTSRDAHMGAHSRRSDLECLGYNLIYWCQGTLPWKNEKLLQQPDQVHHMKEYFMTDVKFMIRRVYGSTCPEFLGEFLNYVGNLAYDERPDYGYCRHIFEKELVSMGNKIEDMKINVDEIKQKVKKVPPTPENLKNIKNVKSIMLLGAQFLPFRDSPGSNKISPKNLRSKTDKKEKKRKSKFSWTEILSSNPDQIARERAEKEFEREQLTQTPVVAKYTGRPTYAILEIENKLKFKDKLDTKDDSDEPNIVNIKGYTKPMMDILRKQQNYLISKYDKTNKSNSKPPQSSSNIADALNSSNKVINESVEQPKRRGCKRKAAPTKSVVYTETIVKKKLRFSQNNSTVLESNALNNSNPCSINITNCNESSHSSYSNDNNSVSSYNSGSNSRLSTNIGRRPGPRAKKTNSPPKPPKKRGRPFGKSKLNF